MTYKGKVKNGVVVLDDPSALPDGAEVSVRALAGARRGARSKQAPSLYERLKPFIGKAKGLPPDASITSTHHHQNEPLRRLRDLDKPTRLTAYRTRPHRMGLRPGISLDNIQELLAHVEGEDAR